MVNDKEIEGLKTKAKYFFTNLIPVHINLKKDKVWLNGKIEELSADFFILNEFKKGKLPVFFIDIYDIEMFEEVNGDEIKKEDGEDKVY